MLALKMTPETWLVKPFLPPNANTYCFGLWRRYRFDIKITAPRQSKFGDYRFNSRGKSHRITINRDLNPYTFLLVFLHEVAHCHTAIRYGTKIKAHGPQWQKCMRELTQPLVKDNLLPLDLQLALQSYLGSPKASSCSHPQLTRALQKYDPASNLIPLEALKDGNEFFLQEKQFQRLQVIRTRVRCRDCKTKQIYLVPKLAMVKPVH